MSDLSETIEELGAKPIKRNPLIILLEDMRHKEGTEVSLSDLDPNKLYHFKFKGVGGSFVYKSNLPFSLHELREKIERFGHNKKYYVSEIKEGSK